MSVPCPAAKADTVLLDVVTGVLRHEGRIFVQKRCDRGAWGGLWEFPGGRVEPGEEPRQAVVREHHEETGFAVRVTDDYGIIRHGYTTYRVTLYCFGVSLDGGAWATDAEGLPVPPVLTAASAYRWASPQELQSLAMPRRTPQAGGPALCRRARPGAGQPHLTDAGRRPVLPPALSCVIV